MVVVEKRKRSGFSLPPTGMNDNNSDDVLLLNAADSDNNMNHSISATTDNVELTANIIAMNDTLQESIQKELYNIHNRMNSNRTKVDHLLFQLLQLQQQRHTKQQQQQAVQHPTNQQHEEEAHSAKKWMKQCFIDHKGTRPKPNIDTKRRRKIENSTFMYHNNITQTYVWSDHEINVLQQIIVDHDMVQPQQQRNPDFYHILTNSFNRQMTSTSSSTGNQQIRSIEEVQIQYQNVKRLHNNNTIAKKKGVHSRQLFFTTIPEQTILSNIVASMVASNISSSSTIVEATTTVTAVRNNTKYINWDIVADQVKVAMKEQIKSKDNDDADNIYSMLTAYDCLCAYHQICKTPIVQFQTTTSTWTRLEDEILFKFLSITGYQNVLDSKNSLIQHTLCTQLLPYKSKQQIYTRINQTLLNPNYHRADWTDYEERRIPICMKIYYNHDVSGQSTDDDHNNDNNNSNSSSSKYQMYCTSTHCYGRSLKSVVDKWNRSINPMYSTKPFTKDEDKKLLAILRKHQQQPPTNGEDNVAILSTTHQHHIGWVELSKQYFPHRHPQRLQNRWSELATDTDILNRERIRLITTTTKSTKNNNNKSNNKKYKNAKS